LHLSTRGYRLIWVKNPLVVFVQKIENEWMN
jgi:hypothetical protein